MRLSSRAVSRSTGSIRPTPAVTGALVATAALALAACAPTDDADDGDDGTGSETVTVDDCQAPDLETFADGVLTIATDDPAYEPWFVDDDPTNGKGYEGAVAYAVAETLGFDDEQVEWSVVGFNQSYAPGSKDFDFDINQISITEKRAQNVTFSEPYYDAAQAVVVLDDSEYADAASIAELADAQLGAQVGTTSLEAIDNQIQPSTPAQVYDDSNLATRALQNGQIDALVVDLPSAFYITAAVLDGASILGQFQPDTGQSEQFGLLMELDSPLAPCVDAAVTELRDNGTLDDLEQRWLSQTTGVPELS